jgi:hypothetical protein
MAMEHNDEEDYSPEFIKCLDWRPPVNFFLTIAIIVIAGAKNGASDGSTSPFTDPPITAPIRS